ncbi:ankyrin [Choiromyces venosus 120613-1]|uniref:Ankyrin n=1 Tax=Choiromyces venosus 120613-1 TaxID=1336337 RepID=A0A3N4JNF7_9PEZI|nr:ankyrin [Choiromyces venosus 120613-1]
MAFLALPNELLLEICTSPVLRIRDIASVLQACRQLTSLLTPALHSEIMTRRSEKYCKRALYHAAELQNHPTVRVLLESGILGVIKIGPILLNIAVCKLSEEGVRTLLTCGIDPNTLDTRERTPLICATAGRFCGAVRAMLGDARVDVNCHWLFPDFTALHLAVWNGYDNIVRLLLACPRIAVNRVDNLPQTVVSEIMRYDNNISLIGTFLSDRILGLRVPVRTGWAPLHGAVARKDSSILKILLKDERIDVNILTIGGETPLCMGIRLHNKQAVRLLLAHPKIDIHLGSESILHLAVLQAEKSTFEILLEDKRIDVNLTDKDGKTALHFAAGALEVDLVYLLLSHNEIDVEKLTACGLSARDLVLPNLPELARCFTIRQIVRSKRMEYLDLAFEPGIGEIKRRYGAGLGMAGGFEW